MEKVDMNVWEYFSDLNTGELICYFPEINVDVSNTDNENFFKLDEEFKNIIGWEYIPKDDNGDPYIFMGLSPKELIISGFISTSVDKGETSFRVYAIDSELSISLWDWVDEKIKKQYFLSLEKAMEETKKQLKKKLFTFYQLDDKWIERERQALIKRLGL